ncbi:hypothetical protein BT63DRAFT_422036 [Microthyrium microscopicum]|uniref:Integral membrane protein n=1 Tax=Microthyrium microscopicum TaxID=703497 RepID=A0A6A6UR91_9PEZI|nr:hypothetical protein BT63DRAFT_422036 [Microthyrium microscopicum]
MENRSTENPSVLGTTSQHDQIDRTDNAPSNADAQPPVPGTQNEPSLGSTPSRAPRPISPANPAISGSSAIPASSSRAPSTPTQLTPPSIETTRPTSPRRSPPGLGRKRTNSPPQDAGSSRPSLRASGRQSSIRIRRSAQNVPTIGATQTGPSTGTALNSVQEPSEDTTGRRRSTSDPSRGDPSRGGLLPGSSPLRMSRSSAVLDSRMPAVQEELSAQGSRSARQDGPEYEGMTRTDIHDFEGSGSGSMPSDLGDEYRSDLVDVLDTIDPEVSTLTTLTNLQNSLFVPDLGRFLSRRPVYTLTPTPTRTSTFPAPAKPSPPIAEAPTDIEPEPEDRRTLQRTSTIDSTLSESRYAVLPHGRDLAGWSRIEKDEVNDHVRHMLHSRRSKFKRGMRGFGQYVKKPLGFFVTLYAVLITLFGLAWVLFLIGWVNVGGKQLYVINIIDNILVALFAIMGDGLAPFRAWDTYNMIPIVHYHRKTWKLRKKAALPKLSNKNDLPELREEEVGYEEKKTGDFVVLSDAEQATLTKHQDRFSRSHTFYIPHETETHFAFPISFTIAIQVLLDCHSLLQIALGTCTWAINYHVRPFALTTVILCCSITCNITAGIMISIGDHKTRKKDVLERMDRQELTDKAIQKVERRRERERLQQEELDEAVRAAARGESGSQIQLHDVRKSESQTSRIFGSLKLSRSRGSDRSGGRTPRQSLQIKREEGQATESVPKERTDDGEAARVAVGGSR